MAWNTPGGNGNDRGRGTGGNGRNPWPPRRGTGGGILDRLPDPLRGMFDGGGGAWRWIAIVLLLWLVFSSMVLVTEQQRGVVLRFGDYARTMQPGLNFKWPWPVERVTKVNATEIKTFSDNVPVLTSDENIVQVEINVQYRIADPEKFLFGTRDGEQVLQQAALSTVREQVGRSPLDTVLGARNALAVSAREQLQASLDAYNTGLVVTELNLPNARPPEEVKPAFDDVNSAQQDKDRLISEAQAYAAQVVPEARGQANRVRAVAEGYKATSVAAAEGNADRFSMLVEEYRQAPEVTCKRLWLETVEQVLAGTRKVVGGDSRQLIYVPMDNAGGQGSSQAPMLTPDTLAPEVTTTPSTDSGSTRTGRNPRTGREEVIR